MQAKSGPIRRPPDHLSNHISIERNYKRCPPIKPERNDLSPAPSGSRAAAHQTWVKTCTKSLLFPSRDTSCHPHDEPDMQ